MLVLTRKQSETIQIGDSITITVLRMKGKSVRLGIKAPHDFNVIRGELAFEQSADLNEPIEVQETVATETAAKAKSHVAGARQDHSWSTKTEAPTMTAVGCPASWNI
jgi:carbon storage regulator